MLERNKRWIKFYAVELLSTPDDAPVFTMEECAKAFRTKFRKGELFVINKRKTSCLRVSKLLFNRSKRRINFLFQYSDTTLSNPAFAELETGEIREASMLAGEGVAVSAHVILYVDPVGGKGNQYRMLVEDVPGIGRAKLTPFFNKFLKLLLKRDFITINKEEAVCYPRINLDVLVGEKLRDGLEKGELKFVELVKTQAMDEFDEDPVMERTSQVLRFKAKPKSFGDAAMKFIDRVLAFGKKKGFRDMKVVFEKEDGGQKTVATPTFREDCADVLFGKTVVIETNYDLNQCAKDIDKKFLRMMRDKNV